MSLAVNRARLAADLLSIAGVRRVYDTYADVMPSNPDLPCFELDTLQPFLTAIGGPVGQTERTLHLDLAFYYKPENLGNPAQNIADVEAFAELTIAKLYANFTGAGLYLINKDAGAGSPLAFSGYLISKDNAPEATRYWGWTVSLDLTELVETTMDAGT